jgi:chromosome segregation ATPase
MKFPDPDFAAGREHWPRLPDVPYADIGALENTIAKQSAELHQRLTEVVELYNVQQQQSNELQVACEEIDRLNQTILALQEKTTQYKTGIAAAQDRITFLENEKADLRAQLDKSLQESSRLTDRLLAMQTAFNVRESNVASAMEQVELLNSELTTVAAERFKLVAAVQGEKRRHRSALNQQTSILEDKIKRAEALAAGQESKIKALEENRSRLEKRIGVLDTLLRSERDVAELKIKRLTEELQRGRPEHWVAVD